MGSEWPELTLTRDMPIQIGGGLQQRIARGERVVVVRKVPVDMFDGRSELQSQRNHDRSLAMIRSRGGFDPVECIAVLSGIPYLQVGSISAETGHMILYAMVVMFNRGQRIAEAAATSPKDHHND